MICSFPDLKASTFHLLFFLRSLYFLLGMGVQDAADWGSEVPVGGAPGAPIVPAGQQQGFAAPTEVTWNLILGL